MSFVGSNLVALTFYTIVTSDHLQLNLLTFDIS